MPYIPNPVMYKVFELLEQDNSKDAMTILLQHFNQSMDKSVEHMREYRKYRKSEHKLETNGKYPVDYANRYSGDV